MQKLTKTELKKKTSDELATIIIGLYSDIESKDKEITQFTTELSKMVTKHNEDITLHKKELDDLTEQLTKTSKPTFETKLQKGYKFISITGMPLATTTVIAYLKTGEPIWRVISCETNNPTFMDMNESDILECNPLIF
jgi:uncharacterized coiled-coil protein SlyX